MVPASSSLQAQCNATTTWEPATGQVTYKCGYVGIGSGTFTPVRALDIRDGDIALTSAGVAHGMTDILPTNAYFKATIDSIGSGGVDLVGATASDQGVPFSFIGAIGTTSLTSSHPAVQFSAMKKSGTGWQALASTETAFKYRSLINDLVVIMGDGRVGIGYTTPAAKLDVNGTAHVSGDLTVDGNIAAKYQQDLAEWVPVVGSLPSGTVVTIDPDYTNRVITSARAYDTAVAGVVSLQPGIVLGEGGSGKTLVATTGRVRVRVNARLPIHRGDLLVSSDQPGVAMKSVPVDVGGTLVHRPGTVIGKALEPLESGEGEILVLLSLQ